MNGPFDTVVALLANAAQLDVAELAPLLEVPRETDRGDYALPCFTLARKLRKAPKLIAETIAAAVAGHIDVAPCVASIEAEGPYVNVRLDPTWLARYVLSDVAPAPFGQPEPGSAGTVVIDYSSPNIAKRFHIGHLRSTVIGAAIKRIHAQLGYRVVGINHLGDWGTQFGHLLAAWQRWGDEAELAGGDPIGYLQSLYVRHNALVKEDPAAADDARGWFKRLEDGDKAAAALWQRFRQVSLSEFERVYDLLGVSFEEVAGESVYQDHMAHALALCEEKSISTLSEGALVVDFEANGVDGLQPMLLKRSDGATLYATRDLAAAIHRLVTYDPVKLLYVVGTPQSLHFKQLFAALSLLGFAGERCAHVEFGHVKGMSTREGTAILLDEVLGRAIGLADERVQAGDVKVPEEQLASTARAIGLGAVIFADLHNRRGKDISFDWDRLMRFEGETGPYLQYTHARLCSILDQVAALEDPSEEVSLDGQAALLIEPETLGVLKQLGRAQEALTRAARELEPSILAGYLLDLASAFSHFYHTHHVKNAEPATRTARVALVRAVRLAIGQGLNMLGIEPIERM